MVKGVSKDEFKLRMRRRWKRAHKWELKMRRRQRQESLRH